MTAPTPDTAEAIVRDLTVANPYDNDDACTLCGRYKEEQCWPRCVARRAREWVATHPEVSK